MDKDASDATYVRRVQGGAPVAFRPLIERYEGMVFGIVHQYSDRAPDSEDLAQEIFVKAFRRIDRLDDPDRFSSWLYSIATNHCRDYVKNVRRQTYPISQTEDTHIDQLKDQGRPEEQLEIQEDSSRLWWALDQLAPKYATPLLLKYRDGLSYRVIARRMDVSEGALKVRVHRARKKLKKLLEDEV